MKMKMERNNSKFSVFKNNQLSSSNSKLIKGKGNDTAGGTIGNKTYSCDYEQESANSFQTFYYMEGGGTIRVTHQC
jgi:hypothetical protein